MKAPHIGRGDALLVVDVQRDFLPGGTFSVPAGDEVIQPINRVVSLFERAGLPIFYSRDWHPPNHVSFKVRGGPWPRHCVASTEGAAFALTLRVPASASIISKATTADRDALSAFLDTTLASQLRASGVRRLYVGGLSTDYSVRATVLDAKREGFDVKVMTDAVRAVDVQPGDGQRALQEMQQSGAQLTFRC